MALGSIDIEIVPDLSGFATRLRRGLKASGVPDIGLAVDVRALTSSLTRAVRVASASAPSAAVSANMDRGDLIGDVAGAVLAAEQAAPAVDLTFDVDPAALTADVAAAVVVAEHAAPKIDIPFDIDPAALAAKVGAATGAARTAAGGVGLAVGSTILGGVGAGLAGFGATIAGALGAVGLGGKLAGDLEQTTVAFEGLLGSADKASALLADLRKFAATTPFEFPELAEAGKRLLGVGFKAADLVPILTKIGDTAAVLGAPAEAITSVIRALSQAKGKGKIMQEELLQIGEALPGFNATDAIAKKLGLTMEDTYKKITDGAVPADEAISAILDGMAQFPGAAGAMQAQSSTLLGLLSTLADTARDAFVDSFTTSGAVDKLKELAATAAAVTGPLTSTIGHFASAFLTEATPALGAFAFVLAAGASSFERLGAAAGGVASAVAPIAAQLAVIAADVLAAIGPGMESFLGSVSAALVPIGAALADAAPGFGVVLAGLGKLIEAGAPLVSTFIEIAGVITGALGDALGELASGLAPVLAALSEELLAAMPELVPALVDLVGAFGELLIAVTPLIPDLVRLAVDVLPMFAAALRLVADIVGSDEFRYGFVALTALIGELAKAATALLEGDFSGFVDTLAGMGGAVAETVLDAMPKAIREALGQMEGEAIESLLNLKSRIVDFFADSGKWLLDAGRMIIDGLVDGLGFGPVKDALGKLTDIIPDWKGPASRDAKLLTPAGKKIIGGLVDGFRAEIPSVERVLGGLTTGIAQATFAAPAVASRPQATAAAAGLVVNIDRVVTDRPEDLPAALPTAVRRTAALARRGL